ncbi:MAG TPA: TonB-dependent receptor [Bryobacteraceae bacterium]|nr:TonB-dependent receptor [Bryobacteraceae bacterium]
MRRKFTLTVFLWAIFGCAGAWAQTTPGFGAVQGAVVDAYGEGIPDTKVIVTNAKKGIERTFMTSDDGVFDISGLEPAEGYMLKLSRTGFAAWDTGPFDVPMGAAVNFLIPLSPSTPPVHINPSLVLPLTNNTKMGINQLVTPDDLRNLPTPNQRWDTLFALGPWVGPANPVFLQQTTAPGILFGGGNINNRIDPNLPYLLLDSVKISNTFYPYTGAPDRVSQDAVQEMDVLANGYPSAFPSAFTGIGDLATRTGVTGYHGDLYDFFRNGGMAARDRYAGAFRPNERQNQAGASVAGQAYRNKLFFFANYETLEGKYQGLNRITNPLIADAAGDSVLAANCKATTTQCAAAAKFIQSRMNVIVPRTEHSGSAFLRMDYHKGDRHTFTMEANGSKWIAPNGAQDQAVSTDGSLLGANGNLREDTRFLKGSWVGTPHATTVNEMRASWSRDDLMGTPSTQLQPANTGALGINVAGTQIGAGQGYPFTYPDEHRREFADNFLKAFNTQVMQFGVDVAYIDDHIQRIYDGGSYYYTSLTAFAQDFSGITVGRKAYTSYAQQFGVPQREEKTVDFGAYFQDTWRVFSRLSIIYGARYEKQLLPSPTVFNPTYEQTVTIPSPNIDGGPRVGLVYAMDPHTVFRAGYDWFFAPYSGAQLDTLFIGSNQNIGTVYVTPTQTGAPIFPTTYASGLNIPSGVASPMFGNLRLRDPRSAQLTASMEKILGKSTSVTFNLIATRGIRLWTLNDLNFAPPTKSVVYTVDDVNGAPSASYSTSIWSGKSDLNSSHVYEVDSVARSSRNAFTMQFRRRMANAFNFEADYTWAHATDDAGYPINGVAGLTSVPGNPAPDQGSSSFDQRHRLVANFVWRPTVANASGVERQILNGWTLSGIATAATGMPQTAQVMVQGQQVSGAPMVYTNTLNGSGGWDRVPFWETATLRPSPMFVVNARLSKAFRIGERAQATLMFEAYNVGNMQFDTAMNTIAYVASGGILKVAPGYGMGNASYGIVNGTNARSGQVALRITF